MDEGRPGSLRVVIADDVEELRNLFKRVLDQAGDFVVVGEATDGDETVALVEELQPPLLILDLMMPKKSGVQVLREVRDSCPSTRILVFSGVPPEGVLKDGEVDGFIQKRSFPIRDHCRGKACDQPEAVTSPD